MPQEEDMVEETPQEGQEPSQEQGQSAVEQGLAELKQNFGTQLAQMRKERNEAREALEAKQQEEATKQPEGQEQVVSSIVQQELQKSRKEEIARNKERAKERFLQKFPQYREENDTTGLLSDALDKSFERLNTANSNSIEDFVQDYEDAHFLINRNQDKPADASAQASSGAADRIVPSSEKSPLTSGEEAQRQELGWSVEKMVAHKAKHPELYRNL